MKEKKEKSMKETFKVGVKRKKKDLISEWRMIIPKWESEKSMKEKDERKKK